MAIEYDGPMREISRVNGYSAQLGRRNVTQYSLHVRWCAWSSETRIQRGKLRSSQAQGKAAERARLKKTRGVRAGGSPIPTSYEADKNPREENKSIEHEI